MDVEAVPYDMPIAGKRVNVLRLYQAEGSESAEKISGVLYPADDTEAGKLLRIRQEYFLSAAAVGDIVKEHERLHGDLASFAQYSAVQLNDTAPVFAIPELIRVLVKKGVSYVGAVKIAKRRSITPTTPFCPRRWNAGTRGSCGKFCPISRGSCGAFGHAGAAAQKTRLYACRNRADRDLSA